MPLPARPARPDGSMSLLVDLMTDTLDSSYAQAAQRRAAQLPEAGSTGVRAPRRRGSALLLVLVGLLTGTVAADVRSRSAEIDDARAGLVAQVGQRTRESDALAGELGRLREQVSALRAAALGADASGQQTARRLAELELAAGTVAVTGPGLVVQLDDAPRQSRQEASARGGAPDQGRVLDRDLQDAVNELWAAGAEAVSVNDLRLTALTAIRAAGEAVLVDFRPLSPPYAVRAVGEAATLERRFTEGAVGRRLAEYTTTYGLRLEVQRSDALHLPAAGVPELLSVRTP